LLAKPDTTRLSLRQDREGKGLVTAWGRGRRYFAATLIAAFTIGGASAEEQQDQSDREIAKCAAIANSIDRLTCFDDLAKTNGLSEPIVSTASSGEWKVRTETSPIDDTKNVFLSLESATEFPDRYSKPKRATLLITCRENSTDLFLVFGGMFMADSGGFGQVTYRIDKKRAKTKEFTESTNHEALGLWNGSGIPLAKELIGSTTLTIRATPFNESALTVEFSTTGLAEAIRPLRQSCTW
jgi:type VI secretion system protein VasI